MLAANKIKSDTTGRSLQCSCKIPNFDLNFAVDFGMDFFLFLPRNDAPENPQKNHPELSRKKKNSFPSISAEDCLERVVKILDQSKTGLTF